MRRPSKRALEKTRDSIATTIEENRKGLGTNFHDVYLRGKLAALRYALGQTRELET